MSLSEEPDLTPVEIALNRIRVDAHRALEIGATRQQIDATVAEAHQILNRSRSTREDA